MKLSTAVVTLAAMAQAANAMKITNKNAAKVLRAAKRHVRHLEDQDQEDDEEGEFDYLQKYTLKMVGCKAGETVVDQDGNYEYNAAVFQLCPTDAGCSDDEKSELGCKENAGEFVVGLSTYVDAFFEDQRDNMQWDDAFEVDQYAQCAEYEVQMDDDQAQANYEDIQFFIGPTCAEDGISVRLALFDDEVCSQESETDFATIANGWTLPYSTGGLVSDSCTDCLVQNDNYEYELRDMCQELYENAPKKCEANMEYFSYYGQNVQGCEYLAELMPAKKGTAGKVFGWIVFVALVGGLAGYIVWWRKSESDADEMDEPIYARRPKWWQRIFRRRR